MERGGDDLAELMPAGTNVRVTGCYYLPSRTYEAVSSSVISGQSNDIGMVEIAVVLNDYSVFRVRGVYAGQERPR